MPVFIELAPERIDYPGPEHAFSPSTHYPECPWGEETISMVKNPVYEMVRNSFAHAGMDREHWGTKHWNPLGVYIHPGDTVLIKPNWVENKNKNSAVHDNLQCLVTNPSVVRVIIDYALIALNDTGRLIVGDAPMQSCDLEEMFQITGYNKLWDFYNRQNVTLEIADLRKYRTKDISRGVLSEPIFNDAAKAINVDLASHSMHADKDTDHPQYKVTDYLQTDTQDYHNGGKHIYEVNKLALQADVIINVPKPKTHRLAGMTAAVKNFVGITYEKASLPHRIEGDVQTGKGDAYNKRSVWKEWMHFFDEKRTANAITRHYRYARVNDLMMKACYVMGALITKDHYRIGSWYGNDTIWRTAVDLNYILNYADNNGIIKDIKQRTILTIGDMIVCGEKEGPVGPTPKPLSMIMIADNCLAFDRIMCRIMGFDENRIGHLHHPDVPTRFGYQNWCELESENVWIDGTLNGTIAEFEGRKEWAFEPYSTWKGHIEK
ncbi:MAG: DUF362 domain-containing protein [Ruminococcaceae bacterium]|nr:DUF362 domain-containing protein [Oscillospiraceae bacterium]